jgi:folate-dependent phosphoribosylglycinamide formyltransferase PurN
MIRTVTPLSVASFSLCRVAIVGDREIANVQALAEQAGSSYPQLALAGLFVPGSELDEEFHEVVRRMPTLKNGIAFPIMRQDLPGVVDFQISAPHQNVSYVHVPYDIAKLRAEEGYRRVYCEGLVDHLKRTQPDWILLANFKLVLDPVVTKAFPNHIVNIHPSVLPLNKGYRTERLGDPHLGNTNPEAVGYTIHLVSEDLDGGPTLFQQRVMPDPFDEAEVAKFASREAYDQDREEVLRLKIIKAEAKFSAQVLRLVASDTPRKIVEDAVAFRIEGRAGFEKTEAYQKSLQADLAHFKKTNPSLADISYEAWFADHRKPYQRVLFKHHGKYKTLETILAAPKISTESSHSLLTRYVFKLTGADHFSIRDRFFEEIETPMAAAHRLDHSSSVAYTPEGEKPYIVYSLLTTFPLGALLTQLGIEFEARVMPVSVTAKRRKLVHDDA